jgi:hypothetical protein
MDKWVDAASQLGVPALMFLLLAYFIYKSVWPFITDQIKDAQAQRKAEAEQRKQQEDRFIESLRLLNTSFSDTQKRNAKAIEALTEQIRSWRDDQRKNEKQ